MPPAAAPPSARSRPCCRILKPGFSVQFAFLPDGLDPDDLVRQHGAAAFQAILDSKLLPLFDVLIEREEQQQQGAAVTPEQRASLEARLQGLVARIADRGVRAHYERELRETLWAKNRKIVREIAGSDGRRGPELGRQAARQHGARLAGRRAGDGALAAGRPAARRSVLRPLRCAATSLPNAALPLPAREALLIATLLNHPWLLEARCEEVAELALTSPPLIRLRDALLELLAANVALDRGELRSQLTKLGLDKVVAMVERAITHRSDRFARAGRRRRGRREPAGGMPLRFTRPRLV